jgi:UDP-N-acetylglucosamine acyltransferase
MIVEGHPAEARAVNVIGMLRNGFEQSHVDAMKEAFRTLFKQAGAMADHIVAMRARFAAIDAVIALCDAVEASASGTHGRAREAGRHDDKWSTAKPARA